MMPVIAWNAIHASTILRAVDERRCARDASTASRRTTARCRELLDRSTAVATALSPYLGYATTAEIAKESVRTGQADPRRSCWSAACWTQAQLDRILSVGEHDAAGHRRDERRRA